MKYFAFFVLVFFPYWAQATDDSDLLFKDSTYMIGVKEIACGIPPARLGLSDTFFSAFLRLNGPLPKSPIFRGPKDNDDESNWVMATKDSIAKDVTELCRSGLDADLIFSRVKDKCIAHCKFHFAKSSKVDVCESACKDTHELAQKEVRGFRNGLLIGIKRSIICETKLKTIKETASTCNPSDAKATKSFIDEVNQIPLNHEEQ